jgi:hypothetical protein
MYCNKCPSVSLALRSFRKTFKRQPSVPYPGRYTQALGANRPAIIRSIRSPLATHCPGGLLCVCDTSASLCLLRNAPKSLQG